MHYMLGYALHNMLVNVKHKALVTEQRDKRVMARMCERLYGNSE